MTLFEIVLQITQKIDWRAIRIKIVMMYQLSWNESGDNTLKTNDAMPFTRKSDMREILNAVLKFEAYRKLISRVKRIITQLLKITLNQEYFDRINPARIFMTSNNTPGIAMDFFIKST